MSTQLAVGALSTLAPKLAKLLHDKYVEQKGLKREVQSLCTELEMMDAALVEVSRVPPDQIRELDNIWAQKIRELSYDMEDIVDAFMVYVDRREPAAANVLKKIVRKITSAVKKVKYRHKISDKIKSINDLSRDLSELHSRYNKFIGAAHVVSTGRDGVDPRVINLYKNEGELVGIEKARDELLQILTHPQGRKSLKIISIVGSGGMGKTTLAKVVHDQLKSQSFDCCAFISVGRNPNLANTTLREMLEKLGAEYSCHMTSWSVERFCEVLHEFLQGKRYNIIVDDVWENETWEAIKCALPDGNRGSKVIITTRNAEVSTKASDVYKLKPLSRGESKELFHKRISSRNGDNQLADKIIDKCDGVPLSIIAVASLLADRPLEDWSTVYDSLIVGRGDNTRTILLYSYYDLPPYLKPCMLYLSMYPEDSLIEKSTLIWRWIAEGFVQLQKEELNSLFEVGERYFNELLNRSMILPVQEERDGIVDGCRVHDIVLDLIRDLSNEENFVTIFDEKQFLSSKSTTMMKDVGLHGLERKVRRVSIQTSTTYLMLRKMSSTEERISEETIGKPEVVRSLQAIHCSIDAPPLSSFQACRVLVTHESNMVDCIKHLGKLLHLRYLEISERGFYYELPKDIGNLKCLQTLILGSSCISELPTAVCELTQLMCLHAHGRDIAKVPSDKMGKLVCLEELKIRIKGEVGDFVVELGKLTRLRVLEIIFDCHVNKTTHTVLMQSLNNLQEIKELSLSSDVESVDVSAWKSWKPPGQIWSLDNDMGLSPHFMDSSYFMRLRYLCLTIQDVEADIGNLAQLPELLYLAVLFFKVQHQGFIVGADGFENLRVCAVDTKIKFLEGAMPRLESLSFQVLPGCDTIPGLEEINLATLLSLKEVIVYVNCFRAFNGEVEEAEAVIGRAVKDHPNRPTLQSKRFREKAMLPDDKMKPDKVIRILVNVRDHWRDGWSHDNVNMRFYRWLEEITCDIDCEGSRLSEVEQTEASLRSDAVRHPKRPKLVMNRINRDKMLGDDDAH